MTATCVGGIDCAGYDRATRTAASVERGPLCGDCLRVAGRDIGALSPDYSDLSAALMRDGGSSALDTRVSGSSTASTPLALDVDELARAIAWTLAVWEPPVREFARLPRESVHNVRPSWVVDTAVRVLAAHVDVLAGLPPIAGYADGLDAGPVVRDGVYAVRQLRGYHRLARRRLGVTRPSTRMPGECSGCRRMDLRRTVGNHGADTVECGHCARRWSYDEYLRYVQLTLESA